ncbi:MAG TPA: sigma-70 family RNA polymerase sigma factor [Fimbriimonadaceae bacterium]|nr:sigma-70 family RNA polymerase sigma factor [Fimbriimonadaceae bacterium]
MSRLQAAIQTKNEQALEELQWVQRCRRGDEAAMGALIARHRVRLVRVAANVLRDSFEAEDVTQEAFLKAFREIHKLRDDKAFSGYIYRICVRLCMDRLRSRKTESLVIDKPEPSKGAQIETRVVVEDLLGEMTPELRLTLVLREMEQLSYEEVAEMMNVPVGTVRSRLHTARERFRNLWLAATGGVM